MIGESLSPTPRQRAEDPVESLGASATPAARSTYRQAFWSRASSVRVVAPVSLR